MPIDINGASASMMLGAKSEPELDWLTFTAVNPNSSLHLVKDGKSFSDSKAEFQFRVGTGAWADYTFDDSGRGMDVTVANAGDRCQFRAKDRNPLLSLINGAYFRFSFDNYFYYGGNVLSLLDRGLKVSGIPTEAFYRLFNYRYYLIGTVFLDLANIHVGVESFTEFVNGQSGVSKVHIIANDISEYSFYSFVFTYVPALIEAIIDIPNINKKGCLKEFAGNQTKLSKITVTFSDWHEELNATFNWVKNVSPTGDFYCPSDLPLIWDDSHIPIGWTAHPEGKEPVPWQDPNESKYLRFTAEQDGSLLRLDKSADDPSLTARLEYKINAGNWEEYTWGEDEGVTDKKLGHLISLPTAGDCVKWRAVDRNERFCVWGAGYRWKINYPMSCSGSIMSLRDGALQDKTFPASLYFEHLFSFANITSSPANDFENMTDYSVSHLYAYCKYLTNITVCFHSWFYTDYMDHWVQDVSPHGVFACPSDLPVIFGDSNIPHGWTVNNGLTEVSEEEILNACYQYNNGRLIIQPDFMACLKRAEQIDYVKHGKTYWKAGTPLPNPHRPELGGGYYKVTSLSYLLWDSRISNFDVSAWDLTEVTNLDHAWGWTMISKTTFDKSKVFSKVTVLNSTFFQLVNGLTNLTLIDLSMFDFANCTVEKMDGAFANCVKVTEAYARTQADCDKLNADSYKPKTWEFVVKPPEAK